jgi:hypothetical protein
MRIIGWGIAVTLLVVGFGNSASAQSTPEKGKDATKVYSYYKKASPSLQASPSQASPSRAAGTRVGEEPAYGTQEWWRLRTEKSSGGDGGGSQ